MCAIFVFFSHVALHLLRNLVEEVKLKNCSTYILLFTAAVHAGISLLRPSKLPERRKTQPKHRYQYWIVSFHDVCLVKRFEMR